MTFIESPRFPTDLGYGSLGGPTYSTDIVRTGGGVEYSNANWSTPLYRFNAKYAIKTRVTALAVYNLVNAMKGRAGGFRVKDFFDYTSAANGVDSPLINDQAIGTGTGATGYTFQLVKNYTSGTETTIRDIKKPVVTAGVLLETDGDTRTEGVHYTVDYTTGIVTYPGFIANGDVVKAGFEFDVPCRFDTDDLSGMLFSLASAAGSDTDIVSYPDLPLTEIRKP